MKLLIATIATIATIGFSVPALGLEAGPFVLSGKVTSANEKIVTLDLGDQQADVPMKFIPKSQLKKNGSVEKGAKLTIAFTEEQTKQIKIYKK